MQSQCPKMLQTPALVEQVDNIRQVFRSAGSTQDCAAAALLDRWLLTICAVSPYIARTLSQFPDLLPRLAEQGSLSETAPDITDATANIHRLSMELEEDYQHALEAAVTEDAGVVESVQRVVLRKFRHRHMVRILWCDLTGVYSLEQSLFQLSVLAECCVRVADQWTYDALTLRFGVPCDDEGTEQRLIVIGMGKLGGFELNVSSDIDLICVFPSSGSTRVSESRHKELDNGEFFRRSVQRICKLLNSVTEEGFVYRVDTRLRPFGESGPLVMNFDGLENYYLTQARDWERYAMIKGRALCGKPDDIKTLEQLVTPFVYRRYLDYNAFESLRDLKRKIALSLLQKAMQNNIKLGSGGIREIEFIGQAFQLVRGGRESRLRIRPIMQVLDQLATLELLATEEVNALQDAYRYLRRVENGVQMIRDEQVHSLPDNEKDQQRLLCILDESDWQGFKATLSAHQERVSLCFTELFEIQGSDTDSEAEIPAESLEAARNLWAALGADLISDDARQELLVSMGYEADESLLASIATLTRGSFYQRLTAESHQRVERVLPLILMLSKETGQPGPTLGRMLLLVKAVAGRSGYLQILCEQPEALKRLVRLFSRSRWLAGFVASQPMVIDELLTNPALHKDAQSVFDETLEFVDRLRSSELDVQMDSLRHFRQARDMRIACAQLDGSLTLMQVSDQLTWLAESIIAGVISLVSTPVQMRFGVPECVRDGKRAKSNLGILAYGKLGGLELGFNSDLDLVFVHDSSGKEQVTNGEKSIDNSMYYARLAQKFVHFMGTKTPAGMLYEIDLRLRPNGSSGVLVTGIDSFAEYQRSDAWTWEHQALMRARMVYGQDSLRAGFDTTRQQVLAQQRSPEALRVSVANMRERMRRELGNSLPGKMHLKQDAGGVADIEFIVQYLVLAHAGQHPQLLLYTDNIRVLDTVEELRLLPEDDCKTLRSSYLQLRERLHRRALDENEALVSLDADLTALRDSVVALRERILGEAQVPQ